MAKHYPENATGLNYITYPVGPVISAFQVNPAASAHVKGGFAEIVASTPFAANAIRFGIVGVSNNAQAWLVDLATGAAGAETVVLANLLSDQTISGSAIGNAGWHTIPLAIPAGTRISVRCQCTVASRTLGVFLMLMNSGATPGLAGPLTAYGVNTGTTRGTNLDPGGTANTKSAYVQITASTSAVAQWIMVMASHFGANDPAGAQWAVDLATGAAGAETVLLPDLRFSMPAGAAGAMVPRSYAVLTYVPAGTRLAARTSSTSIAASGRLIDVAVYTAVAPTETSGSGLTSLASIG